MIDLNDLVEEVSCCPRTKNGKRRFSQELRKRICIAARKYGLIEISKKISIAKGLIKRWSTQGKSHTKNKKSIHKNNRKPEDLIFQEFPPLALPLCRPTSNEAPLIRLKSPNGFIIELNSYESGTASILKLFMSQGGK